MNNDLTLVFSSYKSEHLLNKILNQLKNKYQTIIIENSCDVRIKKRLEDNFKNINVVIPKKNLGLAASYNLGIKKAKTKLVFLNNPDLNINDKAIKNLIKCAKMIKNFGVISPIYKKEKSYKNYNILSLKNIYSRKVFKEFDIIEVDTIDNNFLVNKNIIKNYLFDERFFLYFETVDFTRNLQKNGEKLYVARKIKFHHYGSSSLPKNYSNLVNKTRAFHYNWSKFYYFQKNFNYLYALKKIFPSMIKIFINFTINIFRMDFKNLKINTIELLGIFSAITCLGSYYRPKN